jgi:hypothetical protein
MKKHIGWLVVAWLVTAGTAAAQPPEPGRAVFGRMIDAMRAVRTCSFVLDIHERIRGEVRYDQFVVKLNADPYKVYVYSVIPNPGAEAILVEGANDGKAIINPNRWLIPTLHLSPYGSILRKNHQYTLWHFGFGYIREVLEAYVKRFGNDFYGFLATAADVTWKGRSCYQLVIDNDRFAYEPYTVQPGENLVKIGARLLVNDYMILEANPDVRNYDDVRAGQVIRVPNSFARKIVFYVDKETLLPVVQIIYDDKGLYGRIEITSLVLNPVFSEETFSRDNSDYGF